MDLKAFHYRHPESKHPALSTIYSRLRTVDFEPLTWELTCCWNRVSTAIGIVAILLRTSITLIPYSSKGTQ